MTVAPSKIQQVHIGRQGRSAVIFYDAATNTIVNATIYDRSVCEKEGITILEAVCAFLAGFLQFGGLHPARFKESNVKPSDYSPNPVPPALHNLLKQELSQGWLRVIT